MGKPYLAQLKPYKIFYYANRFPRVDNLYAYNTFDRANVHLYTYSLLTVFLNHCVKLHNYFLSQVIVLIISRLLHHTYVLNYLTL